MNPNRKKIFEHIKNKPGMHFRKLMRETGIKTGALSHHLNGLENERYIKSIQDGSYKRFYPFNGKIDFKLILNSLQQSILTAIKERPGISQSNISREVGRNQVLIHYHVHRLEEVGLIYMMKKGRETSLFITHNGMRYIES